MKMSVDTLIAGYEDWAGITLSEREKIIFRYAYIVGKQGWDNKDENKGEQSCL